MPDYTINDLTAETGISKRNIHFYIQQGVIPPATGAGLGAVYHQEHLTRLKLLPHLREEGMRLDQIREYYASVNHTELLERLQSKQKMAKNHEQPGGATAKRGITCTHHVFPSGVTIIIPSGLSPSDRQKAMELLDTARQIFD